MINDKIFAKGNLVIHLHDAYGNLKDERIINNLVVQVGKNYIASLMSPTPLTLMGYMGVGTGTTAPVSGDVALQTEIGTRSPTTTSWTAGTSTTTYSASFGPGNATGALTEAGILNASTPSTVVNSVTGGVMLAHTTFAAVNKGSSDTVSITWSITIQ